MYNSQNLPHDQTYPTAKPATRKVKVMRDYLAIQEIQALNLQLAKQDYIKAMREMKQAEIDSLDGLWSEMLTA